MAATLTDVGIQRTALTLVESVEYTQKLEESVIPDSDSGFGAAQAFNPTIEFSMKGRGDIPSLLVIGTDGSTDAALTDVNDGAGTVIITSVKESDTNSDFDSWDVSGTYFPDTV